MTAQPRSNDAQRRVFGLTIYPLSQQDLVREILADSGHEGARLVATVNVDHVVTLRTDATFRNAYGWAWRITADGAPVYVYAKTVGADVKQRITGSDLFADLLPLWRPAAHRLFMLVSTEEAATRMRKIMSDRLFSPDNLTIEVPPFGFDKDQAFSERLAGRIKEFGTTHLIIAVGAPKSEKWAFVHRALLGDATILCVGAAVEFVVGLKQRSPLFMRRVGMEWFWRFLSEPKRLFNRYFIRSFRFFLAVAADQRSVGAKG